MIRKIAITGPESTGKSTLTKSLADYFNDAYVNEFARDYLHNLGRSYVKNDLLDIAKGQIDNEILQAEKANRLLFCDTELINIKIWSIYKYGECDNWILDKIRSQDYCLYVLCDVDIPWFYDDLRENPDNREFFLEWFRKELILYNFPYIMISGENEEERLNTAINAVNQLLLKQNH